jgi:hypothetical protein
MRLAMHVIGMTLLGCTALLVPGWLYDARIATPAPAAIAAEPLPVATSGGDVRGHAATLIVEACRGIRVNLEVFLHAIDAGPRRDAMHALDAAYRLATVVHGAAGGAADPIYTHVVAARRAIQDADRQLASGEALIAATTATSIRLAASMPPPRPDAYSGAMVLRPDGSVAGRVASASGGTLHIARGESRFLGLIAVGRTSTTTVATTEALFGHSSHLAATMVVARVP